MFCWTQQCVSFSLTRTGGSPVPDFAADPPFEDIDPPPVEDEDEENSPPSGNTSTALVPRVGVREANQLSGNEVLKTPPRKPDGSVPRSTRSNMKRA